MKASSSEETKGAYHLVIDTEPALQLAKFIPETEAKTLYSPLREAQMLLCKHIECVYITSRPPVLPASQQQGHN